MDEQKEIHEAVGQHLRVAATVVTRLTEAAAKAAELIAERRRAETEARAADLTARLDAERDAARTSYRSVDDPQWWTNPTPERVAEVYQVATVWSELDPEARRVEEFMTEEIRRRYDVDPRLVDLATVPAELAAAERARAARDTAEAVVLTAAADRADAARRGAEEHAAKTEHDPSSKSEEIHEAQEVAQDLREDRGELDEKAEVAWDCAERREATAQDLNSKVDDSQAVEARMRSECRAGPAGNGGHPNEERAKRQATASPEQRDRSPAGPWT
ncbi:MULTISPECIES: hypothetical protein [unclassified Nocardioides]|uniref:hypothetical protein n=1 Tax=unclassified Nocardioides TaxID=2615069 RepID=UPI0006F3262F|nr:MULTISPECIES: hypothetical protein [unclassified Nocardioides]KRA39103.1 hypothetical protein ASD81_11185 [Nocardioides sp. Root614]KRA93062.1 hypothetical protein ASD84_11450 [Nocardioides sp. Root682]